MIRNYLKIAHRNLTKNKVYSFINIGGLAVGMSVAITTHQRNWRTQSTRRLCNQFMGIAL